MKRVCLLLLLASILCSCASHKSTVSDNMISSDTVVVYKTDTLVITSEKAVRHDSVIHDSTIITLSATGDTLRQVIYRDRFVYKNNNMSASVYASSIDTVKIAAHNSKKYTEVKEKGRTRMGDIIFCIIAAVIVILSLYIGFKR